MSKINKILLVLFAILPLITLGEIGYYWKITSKKQATIQPTITQRASSSSSLSLPTSNQMAQIARERTITKYVDDLQKGYISSSTLVSYYRGKFLSYTKLSSPENALYDGGISVSLELDIEQEDQLNNIVIPSATLKIMKIVELQNGEESPIKIEDLKKGDQVVIQQDYNILETDPAKGITAFKITKTI
jgi:hypothetical protein